MDPDLLALLNGYAGSGETAAGFNMPNPVVADASVPPQVPPLRDPNYAQGVEMLKALMAPQVTPPAPAPAAAAPLAYAPAPPPMSVPPQLGDVAEPRGSDATTGAGGGESAPAPAAPGDGMGKAANGTAGGDTTTKLLAALKGVPALSPPVAQKVASPAAPRPIAVHGGNLVALLQALSAPQRQAAQSYVLPTTLGTALGGR